MKKYKAKYAGKELSIYLIDTGAPVDKVMAHLHGTKGIIGVDIETTPFPEYKDYPYAALNPYLSRIRTIQFYDNKDSCFVFDLVSCMRDDIDKGPLYFTVNRLHRLLREREFVAHTAMFEYKHLALSNIGAFGNHLHCSLLMYRTLIHATAPYPEQHKADLGSMCLKLFKEAPKKDMGKSDWGRETLTPSQVVYAGMDAYLTRIAAAKLYPILKEKKLTKIYNFNKKAQAAVGSMMLAGMKLDVPAHTKLYLQWEEEKEAKKKAALKLVPQGLNLNSPKQLSDWLKSTLSKKDLSLWPESEKTPHLRTDVDTLIEFAHLPFVAPLLEYKKQQKLCSTYGRKLQEFICPTTEKIHSNFTLSYTATGRLSSSYPNLQNQPRDKGMRSLFIPDSPGMVFLVADYSQIELRGAAMESKDPVMLKAFEAGEDLHKLTASRVCGVPIDEVTKDQRQMAKAVNFGLLYGMGAKKLKHYALKSYKVVMSDAEAFKAVEKFRLLYKGLRQWQYKTTKRAEVTKIATTQTGKIRKLSKENYYSCSLNTPVQGSTAEVVIQALINLHSRFIDEPEVTIKNCVHDEIIIQAPRKMAKKVAKIMEAEMTRAMKQVYPDAPVTGLIEVGIGTTWQEAK